MRGRKVAVGLGAAGLLAVVALVAVPRRGAGWSLRDPEARAAWEAALEAEQKLYTADEIRQLERVVELEPGYAPAAVKLATLLRRVDPERAGRLAAAARAAPLGRLTPRERFIVELWLALSDGDLSGASAVIDRYALELPDDPGVLTARARRAWSMGRYDEAEALYRKALEREPNLVIAYNQLGYLAMSRGEFEEAERRLVTYRFIAPDQANPHDSLGELYALTGRYDEAREEFETALEVRPDFWASYGHLALLDLLERRRKAAEATLARMESSPGAPEVHRRRLACVVRMVSLARKRRWDEVWAAGRDGCLEPGDAGIPLALAHLAALELGRPGEAARLEETLEAKLRGAEGPPTGDPRPAILEWMRARRAGRGGRPAEAADRLLAADRRLSYAGMDLGLLKLQVRLERVTLLRRLGREEAAAALLGEVERVNPRLVEAFRQRGAGPIL